MSIRLKDTIKDSVDKLDGYHRSDIFDSIPTWISASGLSKDITITGNSSNFYPVVISVSSSKSMPTYISIHKNLGSATPSLDGNHSNGTSSLWLRYEMRNTMWDGNGGYIKTLYKYQGYATLVAHARTNTGGHGGLIVWLRGGTCSYTISCTNTFTADIYYSNTNITGSSTYPDNVSPMTTVDNGGIYTSTIFGYGDLSGNASTASKLKTARTISLTGAVTGTGSFDGSGNLSISTGVNHTHNYASTVKVGTSSYGCTDNVISLPAYPTIPTSLKCPKSLTIKLNGTSQGAWDGSADKTIDITPSSIGAAASHSHPYLPTAGGTMTGAIGMNSRYLIKPNAEYICNTSSITGAICIAMPASIGNTMTSMWIDVYNYVTSTSFSVHVGGYTYTNSTWTHNPFAMVYGANHKVRLGHNGTSFCIYIGETTSKWAYPQIAVRNVIIGYNTDGYSNWFKTWTISFVTSFSNVTATLEDYALTTKNWSGLVAAKNHNHDGVYAPVHSHPYLSTSGGTVEGTLTIKRDASVIKYTNSGGTVQGYLGFNAADTPVMYKADGTTVLNILTSGNSSVSLSGQTLSVTINGTKKELTNTTYSAGTGISLSGTTFSNSGVRSVTTGDNNGTIKVNTGGTSTNVAVKGLGSAAYTASTAYAEAGHTHSGYLPRLRMTNPDPGHASIGAIPYIFALKAAGTPVYGDPEFKDGVNSVYVYNNSGNGTVTVTRISDNQNSANSSGYILQISSSTGTASPGRGGFYQTITSRAGAVFCQIFRAKIPTGFTLVNAENAMGTSYKTYWMTDRAGTGKWEWYCRITSCGTSGTMSSGGHVYLSSDAGGSPAVTWYLSYCNLIDLTKANYDGLRAVYADVATKLGSNAGSDTNPIYFSGGKPTACTYSLNKTVPSDAKFTDTTYSAGSGLSFSGTTINHASSVTAGTAGTSSATSGSTLAVPYVTVNATGHVTGYGTHTHTISGFATSGHDHDDKYLKLTGGTITGTLQIKRSAAAIQYLESGGTVWGWLGFSAKNVGTLWESNGSTSYTLLHSGNYTSYAPSLNHGYGYVMKLTTIDASSLNANTYYPVIIPVSPYNKASIRIEVEVSLNSGKKPAWSTHDSGFSVRKVWETNGSGWGTATVSRRVLVSTYNFASEDPVRGLGQMTNSSNEYVYVRGGGLYYFYTSHGVTPSLKTSTYTASSQSVGPTTTAPAAISESYSYAGHTHSGYLTSLPSHTHDYLPTAGGNMTSGARIAANGGNLYLGNSNNAGWVMVQDICSQSSAGDTYWSLRTNGAAHFTTLYLGGEQITFTT